MQRITELAHQRVQSHLHIKGTAIDATAGNGHDTLFLARNLPGGHVYAFDIQATALESTRRKLEEENVLDRVHLYHASHDAMLDILPESLEGAACAIMFNLGYLPKGDHRIITRKESTLSALNAALTLLAPEGILSIMIYHAHEGGDEEAQAVHTWSDQLPEREFSRELIQSPAATGPCLLLIKRLAAAKP